jgi:hypothetical protein
MKKTLLSILTFVGIGILAGILYVLITPRTETGIPLVPPPNIESGTIQPSVTQSGITPPLPYTEAIDEHERSARENFERDNTVSWSVRMYKGIAIGPPVTIHLDCSTAETPESHQECEAHKAVIDRMNADREKALQNSGTTNTGTVSAESISSLPPF